MWHKIPIKPSELQLKFSLQSGQCFIWNSTGVNEWTGVLKSDLITLKQLDDGIEFKIHSTLNPISIIKTKKYIREYFQLDELNLTKQYELWSKKDLNFKLKGEKFIGIRILKQEPIENLFSFICSANNNISRITKMVNNLSLNYGTFIGNYKDQSYYQFPTLNQLSKPNLEQQLRKLGFGYRAKYIQNTVKILIELGGLNWLLNLRDLNYFESKKELLKLSGVGPKVADCILLMSLNKHNSIPVDTHVYKIAIRDYNFNNLEDKNKKIKLSEVETINDNNQIKLKTLSPSIYLKVVKHFQSIFGNYAGWAHSVLFISDLKSFKKELVDEILIKKEENK